MKCYKCNGEYEKATCDILDFKNVECLKCKECGEIVFDAKVVERMQDISEELNT